MRKVLITGTSSGIGLATAIDFAQRGDHVFAGVRRPSEAVELQKAAQSGLPITIVELDVNDDTSIACAVAETGLVDVLINNAGVGGSGPVETNPLARAKATFETNYFGAIRMIQAVLPGMREHRRGAIVNITSLAGRVFFGGHGHYAASKAALDALSEILAQEVRAFGIRVAIIEPGVVLTPILSKRTGAPLEDGPYATSMRRLRRGFRSQTLHHPTLPGAVVAAIREALEDPEMRLRYLVGRDAVALTAARKQTSDEEWIRVAALEDDEEFVAERRRALGIEYY